MTAALDLWDAALSDESRLWLRYADGRRRLLPVQAWATSVPGDTAVVRRCLGPTLDIGCGPGRLVAALTERGVPALGIDIAAGAVRSTRRRGALALRRDVFGRVPGEGRWKHAVLADGNIGIGGDPASLLRRVRGLVAADGEVLVELEPPEGVTGRHDVRLESGESHSEWFGWAHVGVAELPALAASVGLRLTDAWTEVGRCFAALQPEY